ncbi:hypothetical protein QVD17_06410 [Tagetes erecta]|uniref:AAA+ ATPase domain-containing protein n=1 Tax=Tagetes erecta TaxID=13708 RepID=A0AAD8PC82_TARER|nr:hypothetical protein QVD17_06410 [Tagetes erecta]
MSLSKITTLKTLSASIGSVAAAVMVARSIAGDVVPPELKAYIYSGISNFVNKLSRQLTMVIDEYDGYEVNEIYTASEMYLAAQVSPEIDRLKVTKNPSENRFNLAMEMNQRFTDVYNGVKFHWRSVCKTKTKPKQSAGDERWFELTFHRKHRDLALNEYLPFVLNEAKVRKQNEKTLKLFTVNTKSRNMWTSVNLDHPAKFETLAMDTELKEMMMKDLDMFVERREYYRNVGKAWKRGYLLYGPPGTGKSSLIAAIANYLNFDIYDLELTAIMTNSELRQLLVSTMNRSILVVEDIDCSTTLHDRASAVPAVVTNQHHDNPSQVTLSGFLNFIDGLWSSCGDEKIIIFTTNRKEKLDPALLRPGRMDVGKGLRLQGRKEREKKKNFGLSQYCTPCGFQLLASNYLGVTDHACFKQIEDLIGKVEITPAEVAEQLLKDSDPDVVLTGLVEFFYLKMKEDELKRSSKARSTPTHTIKPTHHIFISTTTTTTTTTTTNIIH